MRFELKNTCMANTNAMIRCTQGGTNMVQPESISKTDKQAYGGESHKVCGNHFKQTGTTGDPKNGWAAHPEVIDYDHEQTLAEIRHLDILAMDAGEKKSKKTNKKEKKMSKKNKAIAEKAKAHDTSGTLWEAEATNVKESKETKHAKKYERKEQPTIVCEITFVTKTDASTKNRWVMKPEFKVKPRLFTTERSEIKEMVFAQAKRIPNQFFTHILVKTEGVKLVLTIEGDMLVPHSPKKGVFLVK